MMRPGERQVATSLEAISPDHRRRYEFAAHWLKGRGVGNVVDAACGCGYGTYLLAAAGLKTTGLDVSAEAIGFARKHWAHANAKFEVMDLAHGAVPNADAVVCFETLEHLDDAAGVVKRFRAAAGHLTASVPNEAVMPFEPARWPYHKRHYTPAQFDELLADFEILGRWSQHNKRPGHIVPGDGGQFLIVVAQ